MTLDELIDRLLQMRRDYPAAATATVIGFELETPKYRRGEVWFGDYDPDFCELIELEIPKEPPGKVH